MRSILITGTDTGIGKTHVAGIIARLLSKQGRVQVVKPVESWANPSLLPLSLAPGFSRVF